MSLLKLLAELIRFYQWLIIAYVIMSWLRPSSGLLLDAYRTLGTFAEPWLGIFRKIIPPIGMIDMTPIIAIMALSGISWLLGQPLG